MFFVFALELPNFDMFCAFSLSQWLMTRWINNLDFIIMYFLLLLYAFFILYGPAHITVICSKIIKIKIHNFCLHLLVYNVFHPCW